jgi:23S rRNA (cytosine1962-C5)-methyltransferase
MLMGKVILKPGKDRPVRGRHPWVFSGAIQRVEGKALDGSVVEVQAADGRWLARGYLNRRSQITVRLLTWDAGEAIDDDFWARRLRRAIAARQKLVDEAKTTAYRLVYAESDGLPGLIVDRYGDFLVLQSLTLGIEQQKPLLVRLLTDLLHPRGIYERSDVEVRRKEGLPEAAGVLFGEAPPDLLEVTENGRRFLVDVQHGHKTGFYLDQRENRRRVAAYCHGAEVLDAFAYTGGFGVYVATVEARRMVSVEASEEALGLAQRNFALNSLDVATHEFVLGDVFEVLRGYRQAGRQFDVVILDPPKFAAAAGQVAGALRGYKDVNLLGMQVLRPGGVLATFSCSGLIGADLFQQVVWEASVDAARDVQIIERLAQAADHPVLLSFPEGEYLKGLICRVW